MLISLLLMVLFESLWFVMLFVLLLIVLSVPLLLVLFGPSSIVSLTVESVQSPRAGPVHPLRSVCIVVDMDL